MKSHLLPLEADWVLTQLEPGQIDLPSQLATIPVSWLPAQVPGTIASAQRTAGQFAYGQQQFDDVDIWYCCQLQIPPDATSLHFEGLATLAHVFWNDTLILRSDNMFVQHRVDLLASGIRGTGQLSLRFLAINPHLSQRRPRPRWKTRLVEQQALRWLRTSLIGRMPGWSPPVPPVGPYRAIMLGFQSDIRLQDAGIQNTIDNDVAVINGRFVLHSLHDISTAILHADTHSKALQLRRLDDATWEASGNLSIADVALWWPHTHGHPHRYAVRLEINTRSEKKSFDLGKHGFRTITLDQHDGDFHLHVNGVSVFCRGACWTPADLLSLNASESSLRTMLTLVKDAGMNMLRVVGTMSYENDTFYRLCDELGILIWQDFMFANMDYPVADPDFLASISLEASQFLQRVRHAPCIAVLCGNSEIEQQAAMLGQAQENWSNVFFSETLPALCQQYRADAVYWPSSPSGGVLPFQVDAGVAHYFGVGAYLRPLEDARRCGVRFTSECLGFSNMPDDDLIDSFLKNGEVPGVHPSWKQRVPRDHGTAWDFEDVRDHYMAQLYQVNPAQLRYADRERYLALARATSGEVIARTLAEWRRAGSSCHGALLWFWRDLWPGPGWGLIDALGKPKAAYYYAKRAMAPLTVLLTDEGLNGVAMHVVNDTERRFSGKLDLRLLRNSETCIAQSRIDIEVAPHATLALRADAILPHFVDTTYAYRFGSSGHNVVTADLYRADETIAIASDCLFPCGLALPCEHDLGLLATCRCDE
ncbi:MAG: glycoside hydrolase family 2 protein, partial [Burkholderiales bacterium]|nr:glycoside hydrolase family 2 protein [Burkholderiales bacterium]